MSEAPTAAARDHRRQALIDLSHELGRDDRGMAILGEGNTSARLGPDTFLVKASGTRLATLKPDEAVECRFDALLPLMDRLDISDEEGDAALFASRVDSTSKKPSLEALFHASLLSLPDIEYVGHVHAIAVNQILCSPRGREFASRRIVPDEVVVCGVASVYVRYADVGVKLAQEIRRSLLEFIQAHGRQPKVILLENHGVITLGRTPDAVLSAMLMVEKIAKIWVGAAALGGPVFMTNEQVEHIAGRPDELYRQKMLRL